MTKYPMSLGGKNFLFEGKWNTEKKCLDLYIGDIYVLSVSSHQHDLDGIEKEVKEKTNMELIAELTAQEHSTNVIEGLNEIMRKYPETKGRLASLTSQVKNVLIKHGVIEG